MYIQRFSDWVSLSTEEQQARKKLATALCKRLGRIDNRMDCAVFGSLATALGTPSSDIDISFNIQADTSRLLPKSDHEEQHFLFSESLSAIKHLFWQDSAMRSMEVVHARNPLVKMKHAYSGTDIQLVMCRNAYASKFAMEYLEEYPHLRPVYMIVRSALEARGFMEPTLGGLGSHSLLMMIVAFLKISPNSGPANLGAVLHEFFDFYAGFDTYNYGITIEPPSVFEKQHPLGGKDRGTLEEHDEMTKSDDAEVGLQSCLRLIIKWFNLPQIVNEIDRIAKTSISRPYLLQLQDPSNFNRNLTSATYRIMDVRQIFRVLSGKLERWLELPLERQYVNDPFQPFWNYMLGPIQDKRSWLSRWMHSHEAGELTEDLAPPKLQ